MLPCSNWCSTELPLRAGQHYIDAQIPDKSMQWVWASPLTEVLHYYVSNTVTQCFISTRDCHNCYVELGRIYSFRVTMAVATGWPWLYTCNFDLLFSNRQSVVPGCMYFSSLPPEFKSNISEHLFFSCIYTPEANGGALPVRPNRSSVVCVKH